MFLGVNPPTFDFVRLLVVQAVALLSHTDIIGVGID